MFLFESIDEVVSFLKYVIKITIFFYMIYILFGTAYISFINNIKNVKSNNVNINTDNSRKMGRTENINGNNIVTNSCIENTENKEEILVPDNVKNKAGIKSTQKKDAKTYTITQNDYNKDLNKTENNGKNEFAINNKKTTFDGDDEIDPIKFL